ncbi:MAG: hypothetical protein ACLP22_06155, partial [Solirubrobacteraceae bacterium]
PPVPAYPPRQALTIPANPPKSAAINQNRPQEPDDPTPRKSRLNVSERKGFDCVEELEELVAVTARKEVEPQCKCLTELDPRCPKLLERQTKPDRARNAAQASEFDLRKDTVFENGPKDVD